jgi:hypothetical protein
VRRRLLLRQRNGWETLELRGVQTCAFPELLALCHTFIGAQAADLADRDRQLRR